MCLAVCGDVLAVGALQGSDRQEQNRLIGVTLVAHHPIRPWTKADDEQAEAWARDLESETPFRSLITAIAPSDARPWEEEIRRRSAAMTAANDPQALAAYHRGLRTLAGPSRGLLCRASKDGQGRAEALRSLAGAPLAAGAIRQSSSNWRTFGSPNVGNALQSGNRFRLSGTRTP